MVGTIHMGFAVQKVNLVACVVFKLFSLLFREVALCLVFVQFHKLDARQQACATTKFIIMGHLVVLFEILTWPLSTLLNVLCAFHIYCDSLFLRYIYPHSFHILKFLLILAVSY